jgi:mevalonate kinase
MKREDRIRHLDLPMNSSAIYDRHKDIYDSLFSKSCCVVSCPGAFFWAGEHAELHGGMGLLQHIPLRVYVAIEPLRHSPRPRGIVLGEQEGDHMMYDPIEDRFKVASFIYDEEFRKAPSVTRKLELVIDRLGLQKQSFMIRTLHELRPVMGCNWSGAFSTALVGALLHHNKLLNAHMIGQWKKQPVSKLIEDERFDTCHRASWVLETALHGGKASGYGTFTSLVASTMPIFYCTAFRGESAEFPVDVGANYERLWALPYGGFRLVDKYPEVQEDKFGEFECGLICSGIRRMDTARSIDKTRNISQKLSEAMNSILELDHEDGLRHVWEKSLYMRHLRRGPTTGEALRLRAICSLVTNTIEVFHDLRSLLSSGVGVDGENLKTIARAIRAIKSNLDQMGLAWWEGDAVAYHLYQHAHELGIMDQTAIKPTGGGGGGSLFFITPREIDVDKALRSIPVELHGLAENVSVDWLLTRDGLERDALRIEIPCEENDRFPSIPPRCTTIFKFELGKGGKPQKVECYPCELEEILRSALVYVDTERWTVYIKGVKQPSFIIGALALALAVWRGGRVSYHEVIEQYQLYLRKRTSRVERQPSYSRHSFNSLFAKRINEEVQRHGCPFCMRIAESTEGLYTDTELARTGKLNYAIIVESKEAEVYLSNIPLMTNNGLPTERQPQPTRLLTRRL